MAKQNLVITSDVYKSFKGAAYGGAFNALEDAVDNCLIGLNDPRLPEDHVREIAIHFYSMGRTIYPHAIKIFDNGIGMSKDTVSNKLYVTTAVDAKTKILNGGTSRWGLGYQQFGNFLGEPGKVITSEVGLDNGFQSQVFYEEGSVPTMEVHDLTAEQIALELSPVNSTHGTMIEISAVNTDRFIKEWWKPTKMSWHRSMENRYNRLLASGKVKITWRLITPEKTFDKPLEPSEYFLNNREIQTDSWKKPGVHYKDTNQHSFNYEGDWTFKEDDDGVVGAKSTNFHVKFGRHVNGDDLEIIDTLGDCNLMTRKFANATTPTMYVYQNDILLGKYQWKKSSRDGGISWLNSLFIEIDIDGDYIIPTNTTKNGFDFAWIDEVKRQMKPWIESHKGFEPVSVTEKKWQDALEVVLNMEPQSGVRDSIFGRDRNVSVQDIKDNLSREKQQTSSIPDFTYEDGDFVTLIEVKDETAELSVLSQTARYYMNRGGKVDRVVVVATGFAENVKTEFQKWNKDFENTEFILIPFGDLLITASSVADLALKHSKLKKNKKNVK